MILTIPSTMTLEAPMMCTYSTVAFKTSYESSATKPCGKWAMHKPPRKYCRDSYEALFNVQLAPGFGFQAVTLNL